MHHLDPDVGSRFAGDLAAVDTDAFETPDDHTVVFSLHGANVDFPLALTASVFRMVPDGSGDSINELGNGTGAFTTVSSDPNGVSVFTAREDYWGGSPLLGKITVVGIADSDAQLNATLAGQVDMVSGLDPAQSSLFEGDPDFYLQESPRGNMPLIVMIVTEPPFDDIRVRQALKMVVDPEEMIAIIAQGHGTPACNKPVWPNDPYFLALECTQDIEGARALLAEAGYPDGLTLELETSNLYAPWIPLATVYKEQAALAGITINLNQVPSDGFWTDSWMIHPFTHSIWSTQPADLAINVMLRCGANWNETFWCNAEQDALQDQARAEQDFDARRGLYHDVQRIIAEEGGMIAPFFINSIRGINTRLRGVPVMAIISEFPFHEFRIVEP